MEQKILDVASNPQPLPILPVLYAKLLSVEQLAAHLSVPASWVYSRSRRRGADTIPLKRLGKYVRFDLADVLTWLDRQTSNVE